jgi:hypothetical protein
MAAADVASAVAKVAVGAPLNGVVEVGGPQQFRFDEFIRLGLRARHDAREVVDQGCTFAWLGHSRRLSKDYERLPPSPRP